MNDVTDRVRQSTVVAPKVELIWDRFRASVVLFDSGEPVSFYPLDSPKNSEEGAAAAGVKLVLGEGMRF